MGTEKEKLLNHRHIYSQNQITPNLISLMPDDMRAQREMYVQQKDSFMHQF